MADDFSGKILNPLDIPDIEDDLSGEGMHLIKKNQTWSPVWKYTVRTSDDRAKCLLCGKPFWCIKGTTSGIRIHLLNCHSNNQDVVNDIPAKVAKKSIKQEYQDKQSAVFENDLITKDNGLPGIKVSCEVDSESDDTLILSDDKKNAKSRHI